MAFEKELPEWNASGSKPPQSKLDTGWTVGEKPPADWWNWFQYTAYMAVLELQQNAIHEDQKGVANGIATLDGLGLIPDSQIASTITRDTELAAHTEAKAAHGSTAAATPSSIIQRDLEGRAKVAEPVEDDDISTKQYVDSFANSNPAPIALDLGYGNQVIDMPRTAPYNVMSFKGLTRINLLGRAKDINKWEAPINCTVSSDYSNKVHGDYGFKITINSGQTYGILWHKKTLEAGKHYIALADVKNGNATSIAVEPSYQSNGNAYKSTSDFGLSWVKFIPPDNTKNIQIFVSGTAGQYAYADGIRVCEITTTDYAALDSMTPEQIAAKYPYVDSMQPVKNPYVIAYGQNELPPFMEWNLNPDATIIDSYKLSFMGTGAYKECNVQTKLIPGQQYTCSTGLFFVRHYDALGNIITEHGGTFTVPTNAVSTTIIFATGAANGVDTILDKPMLTLGTTQKPFVPRNDQMIVFPETFCSNADGSVADESYRVGEDYYKLKKFELMDLDVDLDWNYLSSSAGYKTIYVAMPSCLKDTASVIKYDGKVIKRILNGGEITASDEQILDDTNLIITIANTDSGWGEYTPTRAEIQAYFKGWRMFLYGQPLNTPYNGTGTKGWCNVKETDNIGGGHVTTLPTGATNNNTPYKLQYQLAKPVPQKIIPEGEITLPAGLSRIEVGNGMVLREKANPVQDQTSKSWLINWIDNPIGYLKYRTNRIQTVFKNESVDKSWTIEVNNGFGVGGSRAYNLNGHNYDPTAAYTVTYVAEQYNMTCNIQSIKGQYAANLKTAADELAQKQAAIASRVSVLETQKASKVQPQWIAPTLLNGWVNAGGGYAAAAYYKDDSDIVRIKGFVVSGTLESPVFYLPKGYRPSEGRTFATSSNGAYAHFIVGVNGSVTFKSGNYGAGIFIECSFTAEQ